MIGRSLGHYAIVSELGAGGMGVVYEGRDSRLGRSVAIKLIQEEFLRDQAWLARFEREARVLASLNHPGIATIHGLEEADSVRFLVMELVPGATLANRISRGPLPVREALAVFRQVAEALQAAHEKGIVHRDLKPSNIKITPEGRAKVLDFGLAKVVAGALSEAGLQSAPTLPEEPTGRGAVVGTAAYMSPEQARGRPVDRRMDIWAFGATLYEALSGRRAFAGETLSDTLARVIEREPDWQALPPGTPPGVRALLRRCLKKEVGERLCDIGDARIELEEALSGQTLETAAVSVRPSRRTMATAAVLVAGIGLGAGAALAARYVLGERASAPPVARFGIQLPDPMRVPIMWDPHLAIAPDGSQVVFTGIGGGKPQLYGRRLDALDVEPIEGTQEGGFPLFSRDGRWLLFADFRSPWFRKVTPGGGAPVRVAEAEVLTNGFAWAADGSILHGGFGLTRIEPGSGTSKTLLDLDTAGGERSYRAPVLLPGERGVLFTISMEGTESHDDAKIAVLDLRTGRKKVLVEGGMSARYSPSGQLVYGRGGALMAVPFDLSRLEVTGEPFKALDGVVMSQNTAMAVFDIASDGTLVYAPGPVEGGECRVVWVDRNGRAEPLPLPERSYLHPRLSPDGRQLAIEVEGPSHNLFTYDLQRGTFTKLTFDGNSHWPFWTPRGDRLTFRSMRTGFMSMWWMPADRSGPEERLTQIGKWQSGSSWAPDGTALAFTSGGSWETGPDVYVLPLDSERKPRPLAQSKFAEGSPKFSPDGRWVAYCSNESGRLEVYVQQWPGPGPKIQISTEGGSDPVWSRRSGELFYRNGDNMMACRVSTEQRLSLSKPQLLWVGHYSHGMSTSCGRPGATSSNYDVTADGQRFVMIEDKDQDLAITRLTVILNWSEELKRREGARGR